MKVLSFTGGSTQGVGLSAVGVGIMKNYEPDVIIGTSVSAIFAIPLAMRKNEMIKKAMLSFEFKNIFGKYPPLNKKNTLPSLRGLFRAITGNDSLGKQDELINYVDDFLTSSLFREWKYLVKQGQAAKVLVSATNYTTGEIVYFDLSKLYYKDALKAILASCNIPVLINGVEINGAYYYDGGVISAQSGKHFLKENQTRIKEFRSVWARAKDADLQKYFEPKNVINVAARSLSLMIKNESLESEYLEDLICKTNRIEHIKYYFETELDSLYDVDEVERINDFNHGLEIGAK